MQVEGLINDIRAGKSVVYLKKTYGQEFLENHGLGSLRRNHAWTNRVRNLGNISKALRTSANIVDLEYVVDTVRNVTWDNVRRVKNRDQVIQGVESINQTYSRFIDRFYSKLKVEEIVDDYDLKIIGEAVDLGQVRVEREVEKWYQGMLGARKPYSFLEEKLEELHQRGVKTNIGRDNAQSYLDEVSSRLRKGKFFGKELRQMVGVLDDFSQHWGVDYKPVPLPKRKTSKFAYGAGLVATALVSVGIACVAPNSGHTDGGYFVNDTGDSSFEGFEGLGWEDQPDRRVIAEEELEDERLPYAMAYLDWKDQISDVYIFNEDGNRVGNLPTGLIWDIESAQGGPLATDYMCEGKWMVRVNGVYRCDVDLDDYVFGNS